MISQKEWVNKDYDEIANRIAEYITIRTYTNGSSKDIVRKATAEEYEYVRNIVKAMCLSYGWDNNEDIEHRIQLVDTICNMAEFTLMQFSKEINTYDTVYTPFKKETGVW